MLSPASIILGSVVRITLGQYKGKVGTVCGVGECGHSAHDVLALHADGKAEPIFVFRFACDLYETPLPAPKILDDAHNPDGLTAEQVGAPEGWRLLSNAERATREGVRSWRNDIEKWSVVRGWDGSGWAGGEPIHTYRTKRPVGFFLKPDPDAEVPAPAPELPPVVRRPDAPPATERVCRFREGDSVKVTNPALTRFGKVGQVSAVHIDPVAPSAVGGVLPVLHARYSVDIFDGRGCTAVTLWDWELALVEGAK